MKYCQAEPATQGDYEGTFWYGNFKLLDAAHRQCSAIVWHYQSDTFTYQSDTFTFYYVQVAFLNQ